MSFFTDDHPRYRSGRTARPPKTWPSLSVHVQRSGSDRVVHLDGPLDAANAPELADLLRTIAVAGSTITLDLARVSFLATAGVNTLVRSHAELAADRIDLVLTGIDRRIRHLLQLTGDDRKLHIEPSDTP